MDNHLSVIEQGNPLKPVAVKKGVSTGTKELRAIEQSLDKLVEIAQEVADETKKSKHERTFTEKCGKEIITITDASLYKLLGDLLDKAAKVSGKKFTMSAGDYTPTATVVSKLQRQYDIFTNALNEYLGPVAAKEVVDETMIKIASLWNE